MMSFVVNIVVDRWNSDALTIYGAQSIRFYVNLYVMSISIEQKEFNLFREKLIDKEHTTKAQIHKHVRRMRNEIPMKCF